MATRRGAFTGADRDRKGAIVNLRDLQRLAALAMAHWDSAHPGTAFAAALTEWARHERHGPDEGGATGAPNGDGPFGPGDREERTARFHRALATWAHRRYGTWEKAARALACSERVLRNHGR